MNPFDLSGPSYLVFYIGVALIVAIGLKLVIDDAERGPPRTLPLNDPYQIAWLRGGTPEAARIAVLSLTDRGLLTVRGDDLVTASSASLGGVRQPIERAILACCGHSGTAATAVLDDPAVERTCTTFRARLERLQLMPDAAMRAQRYRWSAIAIAILLGIAIAKIAVAFNRGRYNVAFLVIFAGIAVWGVWFLVRRPRTHLGNRMLRDLRRLLKALRQRAATIRPGAMTSDAMLLAAVFGISALPATGFADFLRVYKKAASSGGGCGSACGSGCGGGGGGGCGGCGGSS